MARGENKGIIHILPLILIGVMFVGVMVILWKGGVIKIKEEIPVPTPNLYEGWVTYENEKYGYRFSYPSALGFVSNITQENVIDPNAQSVYVFEKNTPEPFLSQYIYIKYLGYPPNLENLVESSQAKKIIESINDITVTKYEMSEEAQPGQFVYDIYHIKHPNLPGILEVQVSKDPNKADVAFNILNTFEFIVGETANISSGCRIDGCNGELCVNEDAKEMIYSTCEALAKHACYRKDFAECEIQDNGECGWTPNSEILACLEQYENSSSDDEAAQRDQQRKADLYAITNAVYQYAVDNNGNLPVNFPETQTCIGTTAPCYGLTDLIAVYIAELPLDPSVGTLENTGYSIYRNTEGRVVALAKGEVDSLIQVVR